MALDASIRRIRTLARYDQTPAGDAFSDVVVTGTGFFHQDRILLRELCSLAHIRYCGELASGWTTHLVVNDTNHPNHANDQRSFRHPSSEASQKISRARDWDIPIVSLQWLLDSIFSGAPLPLQGYRHRFSVGIGTESAGTGSYLFNDPVLSPPLSVLPIENALLVDQMQNLSFKSQAEEQSFQQPGEFDSPVHSANHIVRGSDATPGSEERLQAIPPTPDTQATACSTSAGFQGFAFSVETLDDPNANPASHSRSPCNAQDHSMVSSQPEQQQERDSEDQGSDDCASQPTEDSFCSTVETTSLSFPFTAPEIDFYTGILKRPPRGNTVKSRYKLSNYKKVCFVEQLFLHRVGCSIRMSDPHRAFKLSIGGNTMLAEILTIYTFLEHAHDGSRTLANVQLNRDQEWHIEYHRFYSYQEVKDGVDGGYVDLDRDFVSVSEKERRRELVKSMQRHHAPASCIFGFELVHQLPKPYATIPVRMKGLEEGYWWRTEV